jgi:ATP-dependent Lon protease
VGAKTQGQADLNSHRNVLDADHYGARQGQGAHRRVSRRAERANKLKGPILCLVGPPGVGKTSLGKSIAKATGREFVRMALGGVRDEAEIRGHRRTYIGSMPGKVIQSMKKAKKSNPLFLLDEIDKMGHGLPWRSVIGACWRCWIRNRTARFHGSLSRGGIRPLERDVRYDCEHAEHSAGPLMDRMEIIRIAGYTEDEKVEIAKRHLLPKAMDAIMRSSRRSSR